MKKVKIATYRASFGDQLAHHSILHSFPLFMLTSVLFQKTFHSANLTKYRQMTGRKNRQYEGNLMHAFLCIHTIAIAINSSDRLPSTTDVRRLFFLQNKDNDVDSGTKWHFLHQAGALGTVGN